MMRIHFSIMTVLLVLAGSANAYEEPFAKAQEAYDAGRYAEAVTLYQNMLDEGVANPEVHYNLANASFKAGNLPQAVQHYRMAWYSEPRDPDIQANLHFALHAAGAVEPTPGLIKRLLFSLSLGEWTALAVTGYLLLALLLVLALFIPSAKRSLLKLCLLPLALILLSGGGWWQWSRLSENPEWVVVKTDATALFGPVEGSTAHYKLPLGALVRQRNIDPKGWIEVEYDEKRGWLKAAFIRRVSP